VRRVAQTRVSLLELKKQLEAREHELAEARPSRRPQPRCCAQSPNSATDAELALQAIAESAARLLDVTCRR
jgi:hypothetical protein